jgi:hypothetical protein
MQDTLYVVETAEQSKQSREKFLGELEEVLGSEKAAEACVELFREMDYGWWSVALGESYCHLHWKDPDDESLLGPRGWSISGDAAFRVNSAVAKALVLQLWLEPNL